MKEDIIWTDKYDYLALLDDGSMTLNDGVGYITRISKKDIDELYKVLGELKKNKQKGE